MVMVGVLGLQGAVREHVRSIEASGAKAIIVKKVEQLDEIDGLILPGGESTTMRRLIDQYGFLEPLRQFGQTGKPIFGTCAGLILLAKEISNQTTTHLGLMDMTVTRNAFGRQKDSFEAALSIEGVADDYNAVFIRAPYIERVGEDVHILATYDDAIVAAEEGPFLCTAFHPELTEDHRLAKYFVEKVKESKKSLAR
ncbi:pyridoxal 5'-phosphate synthase subunit PdxT [Halolactibacillus alkaliphilus]|uniref:Pyridoxal 5'-phosphate synthase subunit PdxT n=1 Tax=Halolactibacillus alkaliphilus TaxID=442899 RepID=A0A511X569_9BACI|nr:pyridoxal 5'-phosphate synthase glutaminase subunit PdxT [Halolactibacillus alkaliphilus]GEN58098.1 pyridoxal 5'-phosphate synthase subunit PdxT [Halolactibacillus alkaliphilus]GGN64649.1 pyridoxal 5'-phosphate synthase subunit PdxT [Halolactibacillus alkaliphilus]SFP07287.1 5'-phosphate synthase pdxT subunit [Halolactibacillus alkaliphilus]